MKITERPSSEFNSAGLSSFPGFRGCFLGQQWAAGAARPLPGVWYAAGGRDTDFEKEKVVMK